MKELVVPIKGMHCRACEITLEDRLGALPGVSKVEVSLKSKAATIYSKSLPSTTTIQDTLKDAGYDLGYDSQPWFSHSLKDYENVVYGIALIVIVAMIFSVFNVSGLANFGSDGKTAQLVALLVGLTAGVSTCMAMVGGLVLGLSARYAEKHPQASPIQRFRPHLFFNLSRVVSFFILGGLIGLVGTMFSLRGPLLGLLTIFVGVVMLILGLQLTGVFPRLNNASITLPSGLAKVLGVKRRGVKEYSHGNAMALGTLSFFLPCGFTQAMQLYAISTGSFTQGALIMGLFAIGTAPGLLSVGGLTSVVTGRFAKRFFKIAGVAVVAMAIYNFNNGYNLTGWPRPFSHPTQQKVTTNGSSTITKAALPKGLENSSPATGQIASANILKTSFKVKSDIVPSTFEIKAGQSYTLEVDAKEDGVGCMSTIMIPGLVNEPQFIKGGKTNKLSFMAKKPGTYKITCAMGVQRGTINVI